MDIYNCQTKYTYIWIYRLAMKQHPDRYSDPEEKKKATVQFQKISAAYSVLRDRKYFPTFILLYL